MQAVLKDLVLVSTSVIGLFGLVMAFVFLRRNARKAVVVVVAVGSMAIWGCGVVSHVWIRPKPNELLIDTRKAREIEDSRPAEVPSEGYVSSAKCRECHPQQHGSWSQSYHRSMTQFATSETITADMDDAEVDVAGSKYRFSKRGAEYWVELDDPDYVGSRIERPIVMVTGSHHMQIYWYPAGESRALGQVPLVFLHETQRWIPRDAAFLVPPDIQSGSETTRWNETCIACHTTHPRSRPIDAQNWDSHVAELGIACETCHGPGEEHIQWRVVGNALGSADPMLSPARMTHARGAQVCGQCHSITTARNPDELQSALIDGYTFRPGDDLEQSRVVVRHSPAIRKHIGRYLGDGEIDDYLRDRFWLDGMVRISGREYNGLIESPCFQRGKMSCISCHSMHMSPEDNRPPSDWADDMLHAKMDGDQACLQCHQTESYGTNHTHHQGGSSGSQCYNCHMPHTTYGLLKAMRSHQVDSPDARVSITSGRPLACNLCHLDRTLEWSAQHLQDWYDIESPVLSADQKSIADSLLWLLKGDAGQRALAAWHMGWSPAKQASGDKWQAPFLGILLDDPYDAVRFIAQRSLQSLPGFADFESQTEFDFVPRPAQRPPISDRIRSIWAAKNTRDPALSTSVLIDSLDGRILDVEVSRLLRERDDRPVNLVE